MIPCFRFKPMIAIAGLSSCVLFQVNVLAATSTATARPPATGSASVKTAAKPAPKPVPAPISLDPVHVDEDKVSGTAIFLNVPLSAALNEAVGVGSVNPNPISGKFVITLPRAAKINEYIVVSGTAADGTKTSGYTNVVPAASGGGAVAAQSVAGLAVPSIAAAEGSPLIFVTPNKSDVGRPGLRIEVAMLDAQSNLLSRSITGSCPPDSAGDKCQVTLAVPVNGTWKIQAMEVIGAQQGPTVIADPTALKALGKPTIAPPHQGDKSVTVTLNSADVTAVTAPVQLVMDVRVKTTDYHCTPDSSNQCKIDLAPGTELMDGDQIVAKELILGDGLRPIDAEAVSTAVNDALGVPTVARITEGEKTVYVKLNPNDFAKWPGKLSLSAAVYDTVDPVPGQSDTCPPDSGKDYCTINLAQAFAQGQTIHVKEIPGSTAAGTPSAPGPETIAEVEELGYNWGRVRAYFSVGAVLSRNNITTSNATSQPTITQSNFSSPDAFVGMDMDFNWYSRQGCLASAYVSRSVRLATVANAVEDCDASVKNPEISFDSAGPGQRASRSTTAASERETTAGGYIAVDNAGLETLALALGGAADKDSARVLGFLRRVYRTQLIHDEKFLDTLHDNPTSHKSRSQPTVPLRVDTIVQRLRSVQSDVGRQKEVIAELVALDLTPYEARQMLTSTSGFENRNKAGLLVNSYFQSKLTQTAASNGIALATSPNSFHVEGGIYMPIYFNWTRWTYAHQPYAMFFAPIAKLGFDSLRGSATDQITLATANAASSNGSADSSTAAILAALNFKNAAQALSKDVYRSMAFGGRVGFFRFAPTPNRSPELVSYIDFTYGRYDNFFVEKFGSTTGALRFPWRFDLIGALNIPATPMYIGTELNKGTGPDSMSIFVGLRTDLSQTLGKLIPTIK